jgi:DNA replicative helicase MCM subunit Mcm2 (Cdc46/Mcm family)
VKEFGRDFQKDILLDRTALDEEAEINPAMLQCYSEKLAEAKTERDRLDNQLKFIMAETELAIRKANPKEYGLDKYTEAIISSLVEVDGAVVKCKGVLVEAKKELYTYESAVDALHDKSNQIKNLTSLWCGGYFSQPNQPSMANKGNRRNNEE